MTSDYKADTESSSASISDSSCTDTTDHKSIDFSHSLNIKKKHTKRKDKRPSKPEFNHPQFYPHPAYAPPSIHTHYAPYPSPYFQSTQHSQIDELYETLLQQIEDNKKRKLKRKKKKIVKKQQNIAASKIQKCWKKYKVISKWQDPLLNENIQKLLLNNELANKYLNELIEEYFLSEFIPDLLIEILSNENDNEFYQKDVLAQVTWSYYEEIEQEICKEICILICNDTINEIVSQYFNTNKNGLHLQSILHIINEEIINEMILKECQLIVNESIEELISKYLIECKAMELYNNLLPEIIFKNVNTTLIEYILEKDVLNNFLFDEFVNKWIQNIANSEYEKHKKEISSEKKAKEFDLIESCLVSDLLNEELLNTLINKLSTRCQESFINKQAINVLINSEMSQILITKHMDLYEKHSRTNENIILNQTLMQLLSDTVIAQFIDFVKH